MPIYEYSAIDPRGRTIKGSIDADSIRGARQRLRTQGIFATDIKEGIAASADRIRDITRYFQSNRIGTKDLSIMTRQLATLVGAGLPLVGALQALSSQTESPALQRIITDVRERVEEGSSLAKALGSFPGSFPRLFINMVASGEESGNLDAVLENLAEYLEAQLELKRKVTSALFYPILMLVFCTLVVTALLIFVVPNIVEIFEKQGGVLPLPTRIVIGISHILGYYWWLIIAALIGAFIGIRSYYALPHGREKIDHYILKLPVVGRLYTKIATARIARTLGTLFGSGVGLLVALDITKNIVGNVHMNRALEAARDGVREGGSLAKELGKSGLFPPLLSHMIAVGEKSGELENMLTRAGKSYENEVNATLAGLTSLLEPMMIIVLGGIVFSIVISILLPMLDMIDLVQR